MLVTLYGDAKEAQSNLEGHYFLQPVLVNEKPCWFNERGTAIWYYYQYGCHWWIGAKKDLGGSCWSRGINSTDKVEDPLQALKWEYYNGGWIISKDILVTRPGNI